MLRSELKRPERTMLRQQERSSFAVGCGPGHPVARLAVGGEIAQHE